jgi:hypothetical protein
MKEELITSASRPTGIKRGLIFINVVAPAAYAFRWQSNRKEALT